MPRYREGTIVSVVRGFKGLKKGDMCQVVEAFHDAPYCRVRALETGLIDSGDVVETHNRNLKRWQPESKGELGHMGRKGLLLLLDPEVAKAWESFELIVLQRLVIGAKDYGSLEKTFKEGMTIESARSDLLKWAGEIVEEFADAFFGWPFVFFAKYQNSKDKNSSE